MNTKTKNYLIAWIAVVGLVLAASVQAKTAPGRGRSSIGRGRSSIGRGRSSLSIGSRHNGISFRLGLGGSALHYRGPGIHLPRQPVILPHPRRVVVHRQVVVQGPSVTVWISNVNGSYIPIILTQDGPWYIGPTGERYYGIPNAEQLRAAYGLNYDTVAASTGNVVVYIIAANGASIPVKLIITEDGYIGPQGELYIEMPTEQQLRMVYGR